MLEILLGTEFALVSLTSSPLYSLLDEPKIFRPRAFPTWELVYRSNCCTGLDVLTRAKIEQQHQVSLPHASGFDNRAVAKCCAGIPYRPNQLHRVSGGTFRRWCMTTSCYFPWWLWRRTGGNQCISPKFIQSGTSQWPSFRVYG
jgi:hypothetical protein